MLSCVWLLRLRRGWCHQLFAKGRLMEIVGPMTHATPPHHLPHTQDTNTRTHGLLLLHCCECEIKFSNSIKAKSNLENRWHKMRDDCVSELTTGQRMRVVVVHQQDCWQPLCYKIIPILLHKVTTTPFAFKTVPSFCFTKWWKNGRIGMFVYVCVWVRRKDLINLITQITL